MSDKEIEKYGRTIEQTKSKWLEFHVDSHTGKTFIIAVYTEGRNYLLGEIKWFGRWRRYSFFPLGDTVFEWECMRTIADLCERMTREHRALKNSAVPLPDNIDTPGSAYHNASLIMGSSKK